MRKKYLDIDSTLYYLKSTNPRVQSLVTVKGDFSELSGMARVIGGQEVPYKILARENGIFVDMNDQIKEIP